MAATKFIGKIKRHRLGFCAKVCLVAFLGLVFTGIWFALSSPSSAVSNRRTSFGDVAEQAGIRGKESGAFRKPTSPAARTPAATTRAPVSSGNQSPPAKEEREETIRENGGNDENLKADEPKSPEEEEGGEREDNAEIEEQTNEEEDIADRDPEDGVGADDGEEPTENETSGKGIGNEKLGPLFDPTAQYSWKSCAAKKGPHYIPCIDLEVAGSGKFQGHRHHERSCPRPPPMCLVPLPPDYKPPVSWPESRSQIFFPNVAHPMLSAYMKGHRWLRLDGDLLLFPRNESILQDGGAQFIDFIEETVPDIDWGKNIRIVLDIQCTDSSFGAALLEKEVLTISLGLMGDQTDLAQLALERGFPAVVGNLGIRRLPFPSGVFDAIHCGDCSIPWHSKGGRPLLEMNRILRPGGYCIMSFKHGDIEAEEGMSASIDSISWSVLAHRNDEDSDLGVKIYQKPSSNDVYELRRTKNPPLCQENENQDAAWYTPIAACLHTIPAAIEERGTDWPEDWPKRLEHFPEWLADSQERILADAKRWRETLNRSYLSGLGVDWSKVRNVMDMRAIYGGLAAALAPYKVWVMNVVPVHGPNTLPVIFERGLLGVYHDWCEPFSTFPRSYDLLHADHVFSRLKKRCRHPVGIVAEMDRILRPGGWAIIREKLEILRPLEEILRTLHWEIRMTYSKDSEGIVCAEKTTWRP
ncbi:unnamed protein product [Spirodela intermedia]|uniref:Methyltransferase n=1 Tax=Spirodela intermedia TaxID=51605 RepID=A0A7I8K7R5_SPIIN|nr:unnamed protein product [Spirodela intermedia]